MKIKDIINRLFEDDKSIEEIDPLEFDPTNFLTEEDLNELSSSGYNTELILFHGSNYQFTEFDRAKTRTAEHIYSTPDFDTASDYGRHLYACFGKTHPIADLIDNHETIKQVAIEYNAFNDNTSDIKHMYRDEYEELVSTIMQELMDADPELEEYEAEFTAEDDERVQQWAEQKALDNTMSEIESGNLYEVNSRMQDDIMDNCFSLGYKCVRFYDPSYSGENESYVFENAGDLFIIKRLR